MAETPLYFGWNAITPDAADYDGDGIQELALFDASTGEIYVRRVNGDELAFGMAITEGGFAAAEADFDGDRRADLGSYDQTSGYWYAFCSRSGYQLGAMQCAPGNATTKPHPADYDGDGKADPALYDSSSGTWMIYPSAYGYQPVSFILGGNGAFAVPMDYDGDAKADPCVYEQTSGLWAMLCSGGQYGYTWVVYGGPGCAAAPADFDADGKADPTVYCAELGVWGTLNSASNYSPNIIIQGGPDCTPVPGNYYFTNRADYALYNTTNGGWYIAYETPLVGGVWSDLTCGVLPSLLVGDWKGAAKGGIGWVLGLIFNRDEEDPRWAELRDILSEMNGKLDSLLNLSAAMLDNLNALSRQLQYDTAKTHILISQLLVNQAFATIKTRYDDDGGYYSFYHCDTNHPPPAQDVADFVDLVLKYTSPDLPTCINQTKNTILPTLETEEGVLRQWANMAKLKGITPDNLLDHYRAFFAYFSTLYSYQLKGAELYVDARRQAYTSEFQKAATYAWITNTFMNTLRAEVDEYRTVSYDMILTAINAGYNPTATNSNSVAVTNVSETLAVMEFFSRQWLGQTQSLCATFLCMNPFSNSLAGIQAVDDGAGEHAVMAVTTNWAKGRTYGYLHASGKYVVVDDNYAFVRCDFGQQPCGTYTLKRGAEVLGTVTVSNYDNNMQVTSGASFTNWFGHFCSLPSFQQVALPLEVAGSSWHDTTTYCPDASPDDWMVKYNWIIYKKTLPSSLAAWSEKLEMEVSDAAYHNTKSGRAGLDPWVRAYGYPPIAISNTTGRAVSARAQISVGEASAFAMRREKDDKPPKGTFYRDWRWEIYGFAQFDLTGNMAKWAHWKDTKSHRICSGSEYYGHNWLPCEAVAYTTIPATGAAVRLYVGGNLAQVLHISRLDRPGLHYFTSVADVEFRFKINKIQLSFY